MKSRFIAAALVVAAASSAQAQYPPEGSFGPLPGACFGSTTCSIPNGAVERGGVEGVTLGLTAHQRYVGPNLANDGMGTFYAAAGYGTAPASTWNFAYNISGLTAANAASTYFFLYYDVDASAADDFGSITISGADIFANPLLSGNSNNLSFAYLHNTATYPGFFDVQAPIGTYDPTAAGRYDFVLQQYNFDTGAFSEIAINVDVEATPEPASLVLLGTGLVGIAAAARRRRKNS